MARVMLVLVVLTVLYGCDEASSPVEKQEKQGGVEQAAREAMSNKAVSAIVGESVKTQSFDHRFLDYLVTDHYYYLENPSTDDVMEGYSQAGKFVVVTYSVTNTSPQTVRPSLGAMLHAKAGSKTEVYEESGDVMHPKSGLGTLELAPGHMGTGQFIFDVPTDVDPESVTVFFDNDPEHPRREAGVVDLTRQDPLGLTAEESLALQYEYLNMTASWKQAYELFADESKREVSLEQYEAYMDSGQRERPTAIIEYAFPSVEVEGDHATIERVFTLSTPDGEHQQKATQEAVLEEGWKILMRDDQIRALLQRGTIVLERTQ